MTVSTEAFARELIDAAAADGAEPASRSSGVPETSGVPAAARLPPASPEMMAAAADALWPPLRALLARAHGCASRAAQVHAVTSAHWAACLFM